jgi:2'-5' RNA ligase
MRLFFAVPVADSVCAVVHEAVGLIPLDDPPWRWIPSRNFHISLKFLGEVEEAVLPRLVDAASRTAAGASAFELSFKRFGAFPSFARPRVLFYAADRGSKELVSLSGLLEEELATLGFERERRTFHAHLTLARVHKRLPLDARKTLESVSELPGTALQRVERFVLMQSTLSRSGARYDELGSFVLGG